MVPASNSSSSNQTQVFLSFQRIMATNIPPKVNLTIPQTPSRDRLQTPSQFSSPTVLRTTASASSAMSPHPGAASASSTAPITAESLLNAHATSTNPPMAALDAAVTDRNSLAAQNTQLWKLIEKQRTAYGQIMKELDRVRGERDLYRSRLHSLGENTEVLLKAHKEKERRDGKEGSLRSTASHSHLRAGEGSASGTTSNSPDPRNHIVRTHSDEVGECSLFHFPSDTFNSGQLRDTGTSKNLTLATRSLLLPAAGDHGRGLNRV